MDKSCCFVGHRKIEITDNLINNLRQLILDLIIRYKVNNFLFGSRSQFNDLCHQLVTEIKKEYPHIKRIFYTCKSEECILEKNRERLEKAFNSITNKKINILGMEEEREHKNKYTAGKYSYVERNFAMIEDSDYCIFFYNENYTLKQCKSGTRLAYNYAKQKNKNIFNIYNKKKP